MQLGTLAGYLVRRWRVRAFRRIDQLHVLDVDAYQFASTIDVHSVVHQGRDLAKPVSAFLVTKASSSRMIMSVEPIQGERNTLRTRAWKSCTPDPKAGDLMLNMLSKNGEDRDYEDHAIR